MLFGMTIAQWAEIIPRALGVAKFIVALIIGYKVLNGCSNYQAVIAVLDLIPRPHKMTPEEENLWFDRVQGGLQ